MVGQGFLWGGGRTGKRVRKDFSIRLLVRVISGRPLWRSSSGSAKAMNVRSNQKPDVRPQIRRRSGMGRFLPDGERNTVESLNHNESSKRMKTVYPNVYPREMSNSSKSVVAGICARYY